jgi:GNAT superfamily N-acetyltransferase
MSVAEVSEHGCRIMKLFIPSSLRGQGYGNIALAQMEELLKNRGCKEIRVFVGPSTSEFYSKNGYRHYYPNFANLVTNLGWSVTIVPQGGLMFKHLPEK